MSPATSCRRIAFRPNTGGWEDGQTYAYVLIWIRYFTQWFYPV